MASPEQASTRPESDPKLATPSTPLPKGGEAIRDIGEKFSVNPVTGTGSTTISIATSPGRSGFGPQLLLSYDSSARNAPFGFGWRLSLHPITRKTKEFKEPVKQLYPFFSGTADGDIEFRRTDDLLAVTQADGRATFDLTTKGFDAPGTMSCASTPIPSTSMDRRGLVSGLGP